MNNSLKGLGIRDTYSSENDNLLTDFYNPVLEQAVLYDRVTGFFSPKVFAAASRGFANLIKTGGKIRLLTSIELNPDVYRTIGKVFSLDDMNELTSWSLDDIEDALVKDYLAVFSHLLNSGQLTMRIVAVEKSNGIMHQKIGLIEDENGDALSFSGSNNETAFGWIHNIEEFKVFKNWRIASAQYYHSDREKFDELWSGTAEGIKTLNIEDAVKERLVRETRTSEDINVVISRVLDRSQQSVIPSNSNNKPLRDYQLKAIKHWFDNDCTSVFEMATGTGKTRTTVGALKEYKAKTGHLHAVVVVPLTTLTIQWKNDLVSELEKCIIINTSTDSKWKEKINNIAIMKKFGELSDFVVITTYSMFPKTVFNEELSKIADDTILIADEMHNLVTRRGIDASKSNTYRYRLGLSATPMRLWKQDESQEIAKVFGGNRFTFDIERAIKENYLVPFNYHPQKVYFGPGEFEEYVEISREIGRLSHLDNDKTADKTALNSKRIQRARIKKNAAGKLLVLSTELKRLKRDDMLHHVLIYVDNEKYMQNLQIMLTENDIRTSKFIGETTLEERLSIINELRSQGIEAIVAIKCLDEGVDIPSARTAFILSNNTDPREYVQRLGRVLRLDPAGEKKHSDIYDYLVVPPRDIAYANQQMRGYAKSLVKNELIRAKFFTELAQNSEEASAQVLDIADEFGFYFDDDDLCYNNILEDSNE